MIPIAVLRSRIPTTVTASLLLAISCAVVIGTTILAPFYNHAAIHLTVSLYSITALCNAFAVIVTVHPEYAGVLTIMLLVLVAPATVSVRALIRIVTRHRYLHTMTRALAAATATKGHLRLSTHLRGMPAHSFQRVAHRLYLAKGLRHVDFSSNMLSAVQFQDLAAAISANVDAAANLESMTFAQNPDIGLSVDVSRHTTTLENNPFAIVRTCLPRMKALRHISFEGVPLSIRNVHDMCAAVPDSEITSLVFDHCDLPLEAADELADLLRDPNCKLTSLSLQNNPFFSHMCGQVLGEALPLNKSLQLLDLRWCDLGLEGAKRFSRACSGPLT